jgi:outer membrane protein TolC
LTGQIQVKTSCHSRSFTARIVMSAALLAAPTTLTAQVSLTTVVDLAQHNSSAVKIAQAEVAKARAVLAESRDVVIPSLSFSTGIPAFPEEGFTGSPPSVWSATVQSLAFSIPQKYYIEASRAGLNSASSNLKNAHEQVALDASTAYIELDAVNRELDAAHQQETMAARLVEIEQQRAEAGVDPLSELLQAELTAANLKLARLHLETRAATLSKQLSVLTGLPTGSIIPDHASIPEIPQLRGNEKPLGIAGTDSARFIALSKQRLAKGDEATNYFPQLSFFAQYNRNTTILNNVNYFFAHPLPANNFSSGFAIQVPLFDMGHRAKGHESAAEALRATVEAEQAEHQNDVAVAELTGALRELETQAEIAGLKQQISADQLKTVQTELENGNGSGSASGNAGQVSPKVAQLAEIDERQKYADAQEAELLLEKTRLELLRSLGHMEDWLHELHTK